MKWLVHVFVVLLSLIHRSLSSQASYFEQDNWQEPEIDYVDITQLPENGHELFPNTYTLSFKHKGELHKIGLYRDDDVTKSLNPSVFRLADFLPSEAMDDSNGHEFAYYHNGNTKESGMRAGFVLHRSNTDKDAKVYGAFRLNDRRCFLEYKPRDELHQIRYDTITNQRKRRSAETKASYTYTIETFVWSGPDVFRFHRSRLGLNGRDTEDTFLRIWERSIIRDVDLIFRNIDTVDIKVEYMGGGNDRDLDVSWYSDNIQDDIIRRTALHNVTDVLQGLVANGLVPLYDHAVVFTRQDLVDRFSLAGQDKISFGVVDSICSTPLGSSVSMAEISSPFFIKAVAQSMLFAFGMVYTDDILDVQDSFTVMSREVNTNIPVAKRGDRWRVDDKTADALLAKITSSLNVTCLTIEEQDYLTSPPFFGETYPTLTEQCQIFAGASSDVCQIDDSTQCYANLKCLDNRGNCDVDYFSGDSTPCEVDKSCRFGNCIFSGMTTTAEPKLQTSTEDPIPACCCEERDIGTVNVNVVFEPCDP